MCGIAGYNVSPGWAKKYGQPEKMNKVLKEAWFHNIHRGHKAAGFFALGQESGELSVFKSAGQADVVFEADINGKDVWGEPIQILGAHTREPSGSNADPKFNVNNHPVEYNGCIVTHNGTIYNDDDIIDSLNLNKKQLKALGDVDSVAIPVILSSIKDPLNELEEIAEALHYLQGGFAIHAVWAAHPGLSLIAKGAAMPMIVARHAAGAVFYGSEKESVWHTILGMGVKPGEEDGWTYRTLDGGTFMLVMNGVPVKWGAFTARAKSYASNTRADFYWGRYIPHPNGKGFEAVYMTDHESDFCHKSSVRSLLGTNKKSVYGVADHADKTFPNSSGELSEICVLAEADDVYYKDGYTHAFYGDIEIVLNASRVVKDVYNHKLISNNDRWVELEKVGSKPKTSSLKMDDLSWEDFFEKFKRTTKVNVLPEKRLEYPYLKEYTHTQAATGAVLPGLNSGFTTPNGSNKSEAKKYYKPEFRLDWTARGESVKNIYEYTIAHKYDPELLFVHDVKCTLHNELLSQHDHPRDCKNVLSSAAYTLACLYDLNVWWFFTLDDTYDKVPITYTTGPKEACKNAIHSYVEKEVVRVYNSQNFWEIVVAEECWTCGDIRELTEIPEWFDKLDVSERITSLYAC